MLQQCYISGLERQVFQCLGLQLQPLTLGHARLLMTMESPIMGSDSGSLELGDLWTAVYICSFENWRDAHNSFLSGEALEKANNNDAEIDALKLNEYVLEFKEYIDYYTAAPMRNDTGTSYAKCPWPWMHAWLLQKHINKTEDKAWQTICSDAYAWNAARCAFEGDSYLMDELEVDFYLSE